MHTRLIIEGTCVNSDHMLTGQVEIDTSSGLITRVGKHIGEPTLLLPHQRIFPGFSDVHIHAREDETAQQNYKEDYSTAAAAAIAYP